MSALLLSLSLAVSTTTASPAARPAKGEALVQVDTRLHPSFLVDMAYFRADNFFGQKVYPVEVCALRASVAAKMVAAQRYLDTNHPGMRLLFKDCYRPDHVQHIMWKSVVGTPKSGYVADPNTATGSIHSYGAAVDVTLADREGKEVDMGTPHDFLGKLAEPRHEDRFVREGKLTDAQVKARRILRSAMVSAGMATIPNEWWHFNDGTAQQVRARYTRLDVPLESVR